MTENKCSNYLLFQTKTPTSVLPAFFYCSKHLIHLLFCSRMCYALFKLDVFVSVNVNVTVTIQSCINSDANTNAENGSEPILCVNGCIIMDATLNFDGDANAYVMSEQAFVGTYRSTLSKPPCT